MPQGFILFAHGSPVAAANDGVRRLAAAYSARTGEPLVEAAFLESAQPDLGAAVDALAQRGATQICVVPYFLTLGLHMRRDLPVLAEAARAKHPGVEIVIAQPMEGDARLIDILAGRAEEALVTQRTAEPVSQ